MADTFTLADLMRERAAGPQEGTLGAFGTPETLGGNVQPRTARPTPYDMYGEDARPQPVLAQHNLMDRLLRSFGQPSMDALQSGDPRAAARTFLETGPVGPFGMVRIPNPLRAFHGSPHQFDEFRMENIGTGEGAQAYGHGLYFAEAPSVAQVYRDKLGNQYDPRTLARDALAEGNRLGYPPEWPESGALAQLQRWRQHYVNADHPERLAAHDDAIRLLRSHMTTGEPIPSGPGSMYEVNLHARPEQFLDWDAPVNQQSRIAQEAFAAAVRRVRGSDPSTESMIRGWAGHPRGGYALDVLGRGHERSAMADAFREAGIPGIQYLDQGSRQAGQGTRNYVVFNPEIIEILRRYGIVGAPAVGAAATDALNQYAPPSQAQ